MPEHTNRTFICSVLFLDIVEYSQRSVAEQIALKERFNAVLTEAIAGVPTDDRIILDTGDGAAVSFLGDPEDTLFAGMSLRDAVSSQEATTGPRLQIRVGVNLGPVRLVKDINGNPNIIGDGINVAQRIMGFAGKGELLVSRSFYEVVSRLSGDYATLFRYEGSRTDKHQRAHEVYAVSQAVRVGRRVAEAQLRAKTERRASPQPVDRTPARISDAGTHFVVSARSRESLQEALDRLAEKGHKLIAPMTMAGNLWVASVDNPRLAVSATVEELGFTRVVSGPTREAVEAKVQELLQFGAVLVHDVALVDGQWTAVCEKS